MNTQNTTLVCKNVYRSGKGVIRLGEHELSIIVKKPSGRMCFTVTVEGQQKSSNCQTADQAWDQVIRTYGITQVLAPETKKK